MSKKEVKRQLAQLRREMKENGIRKISFMNAGLTALESSYNTKLFMLKLALERAVD